MSWTRSPADDAAVPSAAPPAATKVGRSSWPSPCTKRSVAPGLPRNKLQSLRAPRRSHWTLPLDAIEEVYSTSRLKADVGWGLAWSLDRMRIKCRGRMLPFWISPDDKAGFIAELLRAQPGLKVIEDR